MPAHPTISQLRPPKQEGISFDRLQDISRDKGINPLFYAAMIDSEHVSNVRLWHAPIEPSDNDVRTTVNLHLTNEKDPSTRMAMELSQSIKFPIATAHLQYMGVVASAMVKSFEFEYNGSVKPCNLYVVTGQPPSTGKSGVNEILFEPVEEAYDRLNKSSAITRKRLEIQLGNAEKDLASLTSGGKRPSDDELNMALTLVEDIQYRINNMPNWIAALDDTTIEAAEGLAGMQNGMFNIVSAEAEALDVLLGTTYANKDGKSNFGLVLKAWDGERIAVHRITRDGYKGKVRASIAVIAQNKTVEDLMALGINGRGLPERFLMLNEPNILGSRDHNERRPINKQVLSDYKIMIDNIVLESKVLLKISPDFNKLINDFRNKQESKIADGGMYDSAMLTGFVGKADKHILKLACIYHTVDEWGVNGNKDKNVSKRAVLRAISVFEQLMIEYAQSAADLGFAGKLAQLDAICRYLEGKAKEKKTNHVSFTQFRESIKGVAAFKNSRNLSKKLKDELFPILESNHYMIYQNKKIYINPRLK